MESKPRLIPRGAWVANLVFALALTACAGVAAQKALPPMAATPSGTVVAQPKPDLYTSGQPAAGDWRAFADAGVRTVVNLRTAAEMKGRDERAEVEAAGMRYLELPIDGAAAIDAEHARALSALLRAEPGPVLLHCASGNRVGGLLALAAAQDGMSAEDALTLGRSAGMKSTEGRVREALGVPSAVQTSP
ncbi:MAG: beta-lactamase hydrolase domain-containing protein [Pseudomonadota bacterium]